MRSSERHRNTADDKEMEEGLDKDERLESQNDRDHRGVGTKKKESDRLLLFADDIMSTTRRKEKRELREAMKTSL